MAERVSRWCRRNPAIAGLAATVAFLMIIGTSISAHFAVQASRRAYQVTLERSRADRKAAEALAVADQARLEKERADSHANQASLEKERADREAQRVRDEKLLAGRHVYDFEMNLAQRAWDDSQRDVLSKLLDQQRPKHAGDVDLRGWEWHYLNRLSHSERLTVKGHNGGVERLAFSPDGSRIAAFSDVRKEGISRAMEFWDSATGQELYTLRGKEPEWDVAFSPDGSRIAAVTGDGNKGGQAQVWDAGSGHEVITFRRHAGNFTHFAFSPDGTRIVTCGFEQTARIWDAVSRRELMALEGHSGQVSGVAFSPDGTRVATGSLDQTVKIWDASSGRELMTFRDLGKVDRFAYSPDGTRIAAVSYRSVLIWDGTPSP
jgi:hypothetical protein